jgi:hypothetical protein
MEKQGNFFATSVFLCVMLLGKFGMLSEKKKSIPSEEAICGIH